MRKKFLTVAATAVMTMSMLMSAFADTEKDLIAHYGFDENTKNEVYKEPETRKPQLAQKGEFTSTKEDSSSKDEDSDNTMMIVIIAVVVVGVVIVVVAVASSSKKKNKSEE